MANAGGPDDFEDVRNVLSSLGIQWRTADRLAKFHSLAERSLFAANQILGSFLLADTPNALPEETIGLWLSHLLQTTVETVLFPDPLPAGATTWEALAAIWDDYISYARKFHLTGVRVVCEGDAWSIRRAVTAAWNIEFSSVGCPLEIGPTSAAHRVALRSVADLWLEYSAFVNQAADEPAKRAQLWDAFAAQWIDDKVTRQCDRVRSMLPSELAHLRQNLGFTPNPPSAVATATANAHASVGNVVIHNHIAIPYGTGYGDGLSGRAEVQPNAVAPTHNADFTMVNWFGEEYTFALGVQSSALKSLWEEWEKTGLGLHQDTIRNSIDAERDSFRMDTAFRKHPAFGKMIQKIGDGKYKLAPPPGDRPPAPSKKKKSAGITSGARQKRASAHTAPLHSRGHGNFSKTLIVAGPGRSLEAT